MSNVHKDLMTAAAGNAGGATYVEDLFEPRLYVGTLNTYPNNIVNGFDFDDKGGLVWIKNRDQGDSHYWYDTNRGDHKRLNSDSTSAETDETAQVGLAFNSDGFSVGDVHQTNAGSENFVAWCWLKQEKFFDIVTYSGNATNGRAINHNLGSTPGMIIVKSKTSSTHWAVYHRSLGEGHYTLLNTNDAKSVYDSNNTNSRYWNNTAPTSTQFTVSNDGWVNGSGQDYVAYLFAHDEEEFGENSDEAIINCGTFTSSATWGNFKVDLGFEPQYIMYKRVDSTGDWTIIDSMRKITDLAGDRAVDDSSAFYSAYTTSDDQEIKAQSSDAESAQGRGSVYSRGFIGTTGFGNANYIYMAIRKPHKPASEFTATQLFSVNAGVNSGGAGQPGFVTGFPVDMGIFRIPGSTSDYDIMTRLTGTRRLDFTTGTEANKGNDAKMDYMNGWGYNANSYRGWAWRRASGYFDVVCYTGSGGSTNTFNHNLGVVPEMMWVKRRDSSDSWWIYHKDMTGTPHNAYLILTTDAAVVTGNDAGYGNVAPTATQFTVGGFPASSGGTFVAYLFATAAGISKLGSYTGTGSNVNVDCGFSAGARFVLIKRTDSTGDWYVWDSVGGIVAGNDPYLLFNSSAAQVTGTDYIDPLSSGFTVTSSAPAGLNNNGGTYIFYAIA